MSQLNTSGAGVTPHEALHQLSARTLELSALRLPPKLREDLNLAFLRERFAAFVEDVRSEHGIRTRSDYPIENYASDFVQNSFLGLKEQIAKALIHKGPEVWPDILAVAPVAPLNGGRNQLQALALVRVMPENLELVPDSSDNSMLVTRASGAAGELANVLSFNYIYGYVGRCEVRGALYSFPRLASELSRFAANPAWGRGHDGRNSLLMAARALILRECASARMHPNQFHLFLENSDAGVVRLGGVSRDRGARFMIQFQIDEDGTILAQAL